MRHTPGKQSLDAVAQQILCELLVRIAAGDRAAFAKLYAVTNRKLYSTALNILRNSAAAEDTLQETYIKIWRSAASYDPAVASPISWMATIVRNAAIDMLRRQRPEIVEQNDEMFTVASNDPDPAEEIDMARKRPVALAALRQLSPERRKLIVLAYLEEESRSELSARYGISPNTIKTHLRRTLLDLNASVRNQTVANEKVVVSRRRKIRLAVSPEYSGRAS
jgi:RNA polymerase sigma-70 factor (ECF subfamily)